MMDLISRQAVKELAHNQMREKYCGMALKKQRDFYIKLADSIIDLLPTIQPEPHEGYWIDKGWNGDWAWQIDGRGNCWRVIECSECGKSVRVESNFCPNCGADMRPKGEDNESN